MIEIKPVSVRTLLELGVLGKAKVLCGEAGLDKDVLHVTIVGAPLIEPWLKKRELVMTSGYPYKDDPSAIADMVQVLVAHDAAALVFKEGLYLSSTLTPEALDVAEKAALPVIRVSRETIWADVIESVYLLLLRDSLTAHSRVSLVNHLKASPIAAFYRQILTGNSASSSHAEPGEGPAMRQHKWYSLFVLKAADEERADEAAGSLQTALLGHSLVAIVVTLGAYVAVIWPYDGEELTRETILKRAGILLDTVNAGGFQKLLPVAAPTGGLKLSELGDAFTQARVTLDRLGRMGNKDRVVWYPDSGLLELLLGSLRSERLREYCRQRIGPLIEQDAKTGSELAKTLETYLENDCSTRLASEALFIHVNTVKQRLKRIEKMLGIQALHKDFRLRAELYLALKIWRMLEASS